MSETPPPLIIVNPAAGGGREAKLSSALEPVLHGGANDVVPTEQLGGGPYLAEEYQPSDP